MLSWSPSSRDWLLSKSEWMVGSPFYMSISLFHFLSPEILQMVNCCLEEGQSIQNQSWEQCCDGCKVRNDTWYKRNVMNTKIFTIVKFLYPLTIMDWDESLAIGVVMMGELSLYWEPHPFFHDSIEKVHVCVCVHTLVCSCETQMGLTICQPIKSTRWSWLTNATIQMIRLNYE